ncbi:GGDEF domain-containing phosphodiesterase [Synechococcus sp. RSCCF101]|uniref:GGDEF domain-containing phosphodiesterase n=1 Tax=Synechococcus sp. RSCCF101 TaxID=2511069 RepID=UPI001782D8DB|nr:GGDEF domain-containing phosphodiesterase [Synechococcus sp. RSCCF101]
MTVDPGRSDLPRRPGVMDPAANGAARRRSPQPEAGLSLDQLDADQRRALDNLCEMAREIGGVAAALLWSADSHSQPMLLASAGPIDRVESAIARLGTPGSTRPDSFPLTEPGASEPSAHLTLLPDKAAAEGPIRLSPEQDTLLRRLLLQLERELGQAKPARREAVPGTGEDPGPVVAQSVPGRWYERQQLIDLLEQLLLQRGGVSFTLLRLELRELPEITLALGQAMSEQVIKLAAERLLNSLPGSARACQYGESELLVLLPGRSEREPLTQLGSQLTALFDEAMQFEGRLIGTTAAIGIAPCTGDYDSSDTLLADAAIALQEARRSNTRGSHFRFVDRGEVLRKKGEYDLETSLRKTLQHSGFLPFFQPIINLRTGRVVGFECLVRWRDENNQLRTPGAFLATAGRIGLTGEMDLQVIEKAIQATHHFACGSVKERLLLSVNLSGDLLTTPRLRQRLLDLLNTTPLHPHWILQVELIEDNFKQLEEDFEEFMHHLKQLGVKIAIDDFGTGYSSLSRLHHFPFSTIKIDGSFVQRINEEERPSNRLLDAMFAIGSTMRLHATAEGVETESQRTWLIRHGFRTGQGYLFARPIPITEAVAFTRANHKRQRSFRMERDGRVFSLLVALRRRLTSLRKRFFD